MPSQAENRAKYLVQKLNHLDEGGDQTVTMTTVDLTIKGVTSKDIAFASKNETGLGLATATVTAAAARSGFTIAANTVTSCGYDGATGASACTLPAATAGSYIVYRTTAIQAGTNAITITCAGTDEMAPNCVLKMGARVGECDVSAASDIALIWTPAATNCAGGAAGTQIIFYCKEAGFWLTTVDPNPLGTGVGGTLAFASS